VTAGEDPEKFSTQLRRVVQKGLVRNANRLDGSPGESVRYRASKFDDLLQVSGRRGPEYGEAQTGWNGRAVVAAQSETPRIEERDNSRRPV